MNTETKPATLKQKISVAVAFGLAILIVFYMVAKPKKS
jgi:hypothetical protein